MIKKTESLMKDFATSVGDPILNRTWRTAMKRATVGRGTGSVIKRSIDPPAMLKTLKPSWLSPGGGSKRRGRAARATLIKSHLLLISN